MREGTAAAAARKRTRKPASPNNRAKTAQVIVLGDPVRHTIDTWTTNRQPAAAVWHDIAATVRNIVTQAQPGGAELARKYLRAVARHVATRHLAGHRIDNLPELLSDKALAATFNAKATASLSTAAKATELTYLRRIRQHVLPEQYGTNPQLRMPRTATATPYTDTEVGQMLHWCRTSRQPVAPRLHAALLLGISCGLDGSEAPAIRGTDILRTPWGLVVRAPGVPHTRTRTPRLVPVLARHETDLAHLAERAGDTLLVGEGAAGKFQNLTSRPLVRVGIPALQGARARATWTRHLLAAGASYVAMRQAGASTQFDRGLAALAADLHLDMPAYITMLRNGDTPFDPKQFPRLATWNSNTGGDAR